ncbi:ABC transporter permease [Veronia pacifica]|uniref:Peptide ABC transporter permease n=1 Tax=Veronia pacifica TaxID=1080227 RepID=A0A1C3EID3_9GAMM|nr:ABC transporter permease [Veronia pacifica]ODA32995.1 peptide ABC transporter permease [Veronia pacifica]
MIAVANLAWRSVLNRKNTALLTILTVAVSVVLLLGVERVRVQAKESFANTISGTDLIMGARSGNINLLLYSVFHIGNATNNVDWKTVKDIVGQPAVKWYIPISLGDSHRGFRVTGTTTTFFEQYRYGRKQLLSFQQGREFDALSDVVIGAEVARQLNYKLGDSIIIAHGLSDQSFTRHDDSPFEISGILNPTGTPIDRGVFVSLAAIDAIHEGWETGTKRATGAAFAKDYTNHEPTAVTAVFIGLKSRLQTFSLQRQINEYRFEPLSAIIPGLVLRELWSMMSVAEKTLLVVSGFVVFAGLLGMLSSLLTSLNERRREMAILRAVGARPHHIFLLLVSEAGLLTFCGIIVGILMLAVLLLFGVPILHAQYGLVVDVWHITEYELSMLAIVQAAGILIGCLPALSAYRQSLSDGMTIRV